MAGKFYILFLEMLELWAQPPVWGLLLLPLFPHFLTFPFKEIICVCCTQITLHLLFSSGKHLYIDYAHR